jgi:hypothetical protein
LRKNFVSAQLDKAERRLAKSDYRRALGELDLAVCNLSHTDSKEDYDRLEELLSQAATGATGREAEKALKLQQDARTEISRRLEEEPQMRQANGSPGSEIGLWLTLGAVCGLLIGAVLGTYIAHSGGGDIQGLNDLAGLFVAVICLIVGAVVGLGLGLTRRESGSKPPEAFQAGAQPPYWPPPPASSDLNSQGDTEAS